MSSHVYFFAQHFQQDYWLDLRHPFLDMALGQLSVTSWFVGVNELQLYCGASGVLNTLVVLQLYFVALSAKRANGVIVFGLVCLVGFGQLRRVLMLLAFSEVCYSF